MGRLGLGDGGNGQVELASSVVGGGSEVDEVFESPSHSLGQLDRAVDGLNGRRGQRPGQNGGLRGFQLRGLLHPGIPSR